MLGTALFLLGLSQLTPLVLEPLLSRLLSTLPSLPSTLLPSPNARKQAWPAHTFSSATIRKRTWWPALESFLEDMKADHVPMLAVGFGDGFDDARDALLRSRPLQRLAYEQETYSEIWDVLTSDLPLVHPMVFSYFGHGTFCRWLSEYQNTFSTSHLPGNWRITFSAERLRGLKRVHNYLSALSSTSIVDAVETEPSYGEGGEGNEVLGSRDSCGTSLTGTLPRGKKDQGYESAASEGARLRAILKRGRVKVQDALLCTLRRGLEVRERRRRESHSIASLALFRRSVRERLFAASPDKLASMCFRHLVTGRTATPELLRDHIMRDFVVVGKQLWHTGETDEFGQVPHQPQSSTLATLDVWNSRADLLAFEVGVTSDNVLLTTCDVPVAAIVSGCENGGQHDRKGVVLGEDHCNRVFLGDYTFLEVQRMVVARKRAPYLPNGPPPFPGKQPAGRQDGEGEERLRRNGGVACRIETLRGALASVGKHAARTHA